MTKKELTEALAAAQNSLAEARNDYEAEKTRRMEWEKAGKCRPNETRKTHVLFFRESRPTGEGRWSVVVAQITGLVIGRVGPAKGGGYGFEPFPTVGCFTDAVLREIADYVSVQELELAS